MSILNTILQKLGIEKVAVPPAVPAKPAAAPASAPTPAAAASDRPSGYPSPARPASVPIVDVMSKLDNMAGEKSGLDWKVSIVDLLKLLKMDSSLEARKELAMELSCPSSVMGDSAKMNTWLHQALLNTIAANGGNIPPALLK